MLAILLLLNVATFEHKVGVNAAQVRGLHFEVKSRAAEVDVRYRLLRGSHGVRLLILPQVDEARFLAGRDVNLLASTEFAVEGTLSASVTVPGHYTLLIDNRANPESSVLVDIRGTVAYVRPPVVARVLPQQQRRLIIAASLAIFFVIAVAAGRGLLRATRRRNSALPPPYA